jgi:imidazoleglycerol-phosphate dehydratase
MTYTRDTLETQITLSLKLYGSGVYAIKTPIPFFTHMLEQLTKHSGFDLELTVTGDDPHHIIEDVGILLGRAFQESLVDKSGIARYSDILLPMDDALVQVAMDLSGRSYLAFEANFPSPSTSAFEVEWCREFFAGFLQTAKINLHIKLLSGLNTHHMIEAIFKGVAVCLKRALIKQGNALPTTKGVL